MFCTKCGSEMPDGTDFCTNCGARMGAASPAAGMPPVQKKSHKRAVIIGICVAGVLVAGGAALALTGVLGPLGQGNSSQITVLGSDEGSGEHKDKGSAKVDLNDQATYAATNLFLSNFTEEDFGYNKNDPSSLFDVTDGLSAEEQRDMTFFIFNHFLDNGSKRVERGSDIGGKRYGFKIAIDAVHSEMNRLFGMTLSDDEMQFDDNEGKYDEVIQALGTRATVQDGYLYFNEEHGVAKIAVPAIVTAAEDLGNNTYRLTFEAYVAQSYNGGPSPLVSDVPESVYGLPADQLKATIGVDSTSAMSGTAVVKVAAGDGAPAFALQSINYD